jgi:glycosyltransferase involved in cell wall biosynthesis
MSTVSFRARGGMNSRPMVSVVIPVRNEGMRIGAALRSLVDGRSDDFPLEIVVVDDGSSDGCCDGLEGRFASERVGVKIVRLPQWSGIPFARNAGAAAASAGILFITDGNVVFPGNWDVPVRRELGANRVLCATIADSGSSFRGYGCTLLLESMGLSWLVDADAYGSHVPVSPCTGTVLSAELFHRAGGYDTAMPIYGAAEPEFSVRLWLSGAEIVSVPDLVLSHRFRPTSERQPFLDDIGVVQIANYLRFGMLYLDKEQIERMLAHYWARSPLLMPEALQRVAAGGVWERRRLLEERLPGRFADFVNRFQLDRTSPVAGRVSSDDLEGQLQHV